MAVVIPTLGANIAGLAIDTLMLLLIIAGFVILYRIKSMCHKSMQKSWNLFFIALVIGLVRESGALAINVGAVDPLLIADALVVMRMLFFAVFIYALWLQDRLLCEIRDHKLGRRSEK